MNRSEVHAPISQQQPTISSNLKPIFKQTVTWRCMNPSDIAFLSKSRPKMFRGVTIKSLCFEKVGTVGIRQLRKGLTSTKRVCNVSFSTLNVNVKQLTYLLDSTNHWNDFSLSGAGNSNISHQELIKALSRLGKCKKLINFPLPDLSIQDANRETATHIYHQLKGLKKLEDLSLNLPFHSNLCIWDFRLPQLLQSLGLDLTNKSVVPQQKLSSFLTRIQQQCHHLECMTLSFSSEYLLEPTDAQIWVTFFQNPPKSLKYLHILLNSPDNQTSEGLQAFFGSLQHLKYLKTLNLAAYCPFAFNQTFPFLEGYFSDLLNNLHSLSQLENLRLRFFSSFPNLDKKDTQHLSCMLQNLKNLKSLDIALPALNSPEEGLVSIAEGLKQLNCLEELKMLIFNNFNFESMAALSRNIAHLPLTGLNLNFYASSRSPAPIKQNLSKIVTFWKSNNLTPFFSDLKNFSQLADLTLRLSSFEISNHEWKHLSLALQNFTQLSYLSLTLPQFDSAKSFKGLQRFLSSLKHLPKLTTLDLKFEGERILDPEIEILSSQLAGCQALTNLNLEFTHAAQLNDQSLYSLLPTLQSLLKLKDLALVFERQEGFGQKAESDLVEGLVVLKELSSFTFVFNPLSLWENNRVTLPPNLLGYEKLRHLESLIVNTSRYI